MRTVHSLKALIIAVFCTAFTLDAHAALCSRVHTFVDGAILTAAQLETEFNTIFDCDNSISNANISASAAIDPSKISATLAGEGLGRDGSTGVLSVNTDGVTLESNADTLRIKDNGVSNAKLRQSAALSVVGNSTNATANLADITASSDHTVLKRSGTALAFGGVTSADITDGTIATADLADGSVTQAKRAALGQQVSSSSGAFSTTSTTGADVTNLSVSITTTGRPVWVGLINDGSGSQASLSTRSTTGSAPVCRFELVRGATSLGLNSLDAINPSSTTNNTWIDVPVSSLNTIDVPAANTYTYKVQASASGSNITCSVFYAKLVAFEL